MAKTVTRLTLEPGGGWRIAALGPLAARLRNEGRTRLRLRPGPDAPVPEFDAAGETLEPGAVYGEVALEAGEAVWARNLSAAHPARLLVSTDDAGFTGGGLAGDTP